MVSFLRWKIKGNSGDWNVDLANENVGRSVGRERERYLGYWVCTGGRGCGLNGVILHNVSLQSFRYYINEVSSASSSRGSC